MDALSNIGVHFKEKLRRNNIFRVQERRSRV
jgi:hypothetical protein